MGGKSALCLRSDRFGAWHPYRCPDSDPLPVWERVYSNLAHDLCLDHHSDSLAIGPDRSVKSPGNTTASGTHGSKYGGIFGCYFSSAGVTVHPACVLHLVQELRRFPPSSLFFSRSDPATSIVRREQNLDMPAIKEQGPVRPKFVPDFPDPACDLAETDDPAWISVIENDAYFNLESVSRP